MPSGTPTCMRSDGRTPLTAPCTIPPLRGGTQPASRHRVVDRERAAVDRVAAVRGGLQKHWEGSERADIEAAHAIYAAHAILDYPQSGERFRGRSRIQAQRGGHPSERHFTLLRILGGGDLWVSECIVTYDGVPPCVVSVMEIADGLVAHEPQYFADPSPAAPGRP